MTTEIVPKPTAAMAPADAASMSALLTLAVDKGLSVEGLEKLVALQERIMDRNAATDFFAAMAEFQSKCPPIPKSSSAKVVKDGRTIAEYHYAELPTIAAIINPILSRVGLSYTWDSSIDEKGLLTCVCRVQHASGHHTESRFSCPIGGTSLMSDAQKGAASLTYAKRQALVSVLGLTTGDADIDGGTLADPTTDYISPGQAMNVEAMLTEVKADRARFLKFFGIQKIEDMPSNRLAEAIHMLEEKRK